MNTTPRMTASDVTHDWHVIDATGRPLGRLASEVAALLRGKHKPTYEPHLDDGDYVIVLNASRVRLTGRKTSQMRYIRHSGYPGGLHERTFTEQFARHPDRVLERAIWGMLPGGPLGRAMFRHLKIYPGSHHPHQAQVIGSQRAQAARSEQAAAAGPRPLKVVHLRPLSGAELPVVPEVAPEPSPEPEPPAPPPAPRARRARRSTAAPEASPGTTPEAEVAETPPAETLEPGAGEPPPVEEQEATPPPAGSEAPATEGSAAPRRTRRRATTTSQETED